MERAPYRDQARIIRRSKAIRYTIFVVLFLTASAWMVWRSNVQTESTSAAERLALGAQVYAANCASCHSENGEGHAEVAAAPALNASEHAWHHPDGQLQQLILEGGQLMPAFSERLTNNEVIAVIRYFQTWWAPGQLQSQQSISEQFPLQD